MIGTPGKAARRWLDRGAGPSTASALPLLAALAVACQGQDARPWAASDHDREPAEQARGAAVAQQPPRAAAARTAAPRGREEALRAWRQHCVRCHGQGGQGDGPAAGTLGLADLTAPSVAQQSDEQLAAVIRDGRGTMPASKLPPATIAGLVAHIRTLGR